MAKFKLGSERREIRMPHERSNKNMPKRGKIIPKDNLEPGVVAEANNDGSIFVDSKINPNSMKFRKAVKHEQQHIDDMSVGKADYGDEWVMWEDKIYFRREIDGKKVIDGPAGRLPEGHPDHPWEKVAIAAEVDGRAPEGYEGIHEDIGEDGKSPMKGFFQNLKRHAKNVVQNTPIAIGIRALKGEDPLKIDTGESQEAEGEAADPCAECEQSQGGEVSGDPKHQAAMQAKSAKEKLFGGKGMVSGLTGSGLNFEKLKQRGSKTNTPVDIEALKSGIPGGWMSDRRLKKDIKLVGESPSGLKIYTFKYIDEMCDNGIYEGVMSDEIPSNAVIKHDSGYDMVDYTQLDVDFKRI